MHDYKRNDKTSISVTNDTPFVFYARFITTILFLRIKYSQPITFQYFYMKIIEKIKTDGGFVEQTEFKTLSKYIFNTFAISQDFIEIIDKTSCT